MQFNDLKLDIIYEIFRYVIEIDDRDGPFTLMMVCTQWQDFVIKSPCMWTWITIDHSISDLEQRVRIASHLSAGLPLQITIKIPSLRLSELQSLLNHCRFLFIDRRKPYVEEEIQTAEQEISQMLLKSPSPILERIYSTVEGVRAPFLSQPFFDFLSHDNVVNLRALFEAFSTKMISDVHLDENSIYHPIQDTVYLPSVDTPLLWEALAHLSHLTSLGISTSQGWPSKRRSIGHLTLPQLRNLTFDFSMKTTENLSVLDILSNLRAPNIHTVYLLGDATNGMIFEAISAMSRSMQPIHLELYSGNAFSSNKFNWTHDSAPQRPYLLNRLEHLEVTVRGNYDDTAISLIMVQINRMAAAAPRLQFLTLDFQKHGTAFLSLLDPVSCLVGVLLHWKDYEYARMKEIVDDSNIEMTYSLNSTPRESAHCDISKLHQEGEVSLTGGNHQHDITVPHSMKKVTQERAVTQRQTIRSRNFRISKLTFFLGAEDLGMCFGALGIDAIEVGTLIIRRSEIDSTPSPVSPRAGLPDLWMQSLQNLDIQGITFVQSNQNSTLAYHEVQGISLPGLKTLRCPPSVATHLIKNQFVPQLRSLTLSFVKDAQSEAAIVWEDLATVLTTTDFARSLQITTLGLEFYPDWNSLVQLIELYVKGEANEPSLQHLKLPGLPHPSILEQLVYALRGKKTDDGLISLRLEELSSSFNPASRLLGCGYCRRSGWVCYEGKKKGTCWRHTPEKLVTITMDTL